MEKAGKLRVDASAKGRCSKEKGIYKISSGTAVKAATVSGKYRYDVQTVWSTLVSETAHMNLTEADPCLCAVTFLDGEHKEKNVEVMAWKTVKGSYPDTEHVKFTTLPEVTVASCTFKGGYHLITEVYAAVAAWMDANGYESVDPMFNIYHVSPHETHNPDEFVTEVCYPVKKK